MKVWEAIRLGFKIPTLSPSIFFPAALSSAVYSIFDYFTLAFYQPGEEPTLIKGLTGILSLGEFIIFFLLILPISTFLIVVIAKMAYDSIVSKPNIGEALSLAIKKFIPFVIAYILWGLIALFGFIFFILPGFFLAIKLMFCSYFILFENKGIFESLSCSWQLVKGNWWRVFVLVVFWWIIFGIPGLFTTGLERIAESLVIFVLYLFWKIWITSSFVAAYNQLRGGAEKTETIAQ